MILGAHKQGFESVLPPFNWVAHALQILPDAPACFSCRGLPGVCPGLRGRNEFKQPGKALLAESNTN